MLVWLLGVVGTLLLTWALLLAALYARRPAEGTLRQAVRVMPDAFRLVRRLATDRRVPLGTRIVVWCLVVYLLSPIDLVPDFVPVLGYADDAILTALVLRHLVRRTGLEVLMERWPGDAPGLRTLLALLGLATDL